MDDIEILKKLIAKGHIESSANVYLTKFKRIMNYVLEGKVELFPDAFKKVLYLHPNKYSEEVLDFINKPEITIYEKESLLKGFIKCLEALDIDTTIYLEKFQPKLTDLKYDKEYQESTKKEEENKLSQNDLIKLRDEWKVQLTDKFTKYDIYYVLLSLYTYIQPLRSQDYYNTRLVSQYWSHRKDKINHLDLSEKKLYLYDYKTASTYGTREISVPDELIKILDDFNKKSLSGYIICSPKGQKLEANNFNRMFNEATKGKKFSCNMARKCFVAEGIDNNKPIEERKNDARIMAHSTSTAQCYYSKFSKYLHNDDNSLESLIEQRKLLNKLQRDLDSKILNKLKLIE